MRTNVRLDLDDSAGCTGPANAGLENTAQKIARDTNRVARIKLPGKDGFTLRLGLLLAPPATTPRSSV